MRIEFTDRFDIPSATAQQRGHGAHGKTWPSLGLKAARAAWQALFERHRPKKPLEGAIAIQFILWYYRKGLAHDAVQPRVVRPDVDNLTKVIFDALMAAGVILDDASIFDHHGVKLEYAGPPKVHFIIENWEEPKK